MEIKVDTARVFVPLIKPSRYKGAHGGRGSGKSHFFAERLIEDHLANPGLRSVCVREVQRALKESSKRLLEDKIEALGVGRLFKVYREVIATPGDGVIGFTGMADHTAESIKSLEGYGRAWVDEAQAISARSLELLRPTIRTEGSEIWFSWNPRRKTDPVDAMFRAGTPPTDAIVVRANWSDNPMFPAVLNQERLDCLANEPDRYPHVWEGEYATAVTGAYYAQVLAKARQEGRVGVVPADPILPLRLFTDIGGTGARADSWVWWVAQFVGREIRVLDYYEASGQPLATHIEWARKRGYTPGRCEVWLPHDGSSYDTVFDVSPESALRDAGYATEVVPNQGRGAAATRIAAGRRVFPACWFNEPAAGQQADVPTTAPGLEALGWYHERRDPERDIGLGPEHDWSSHGADAFGLMAIVAERLLASTGVNRTTGLRRRGSPMAV